MISIKDIYCPENLLEEYELEEYTEDIVNAISQVCEPQDTEQKNRVVEGFPKGFWISVHREPLIENQFELFSNTNIGVTLVYKDFPLLGFFVNTKTEQWKEEAEKDIKNMVKIVYLPQFRERILN